jgi:hypothetical protein
MSIITNSQNVKYCFKFETNIQENEMRLKELNNPMFIHLGAKLKNSTYVSLHQLLDSKTYFRFGFLHAVSIRYGAGETGPGQNYRWGG